MTCLHFLMSLKGPEIDLTRAYNNVLRHVIVAKRGQNILWSVEFSIDDGLDAVVLASIPDLYNFISSKTN